MLVLFLPLIHPILLRLPTHSSSSSSSLEMIPTAHRARNSQPPSWIHSHPQHTRIPFRHFSDLQRLNAPPLPSSPPDLICDSRFLPSLSLASCAAFALCSRRCRLRCRCRSVAVRLMVPTLMSVARPHMPLPHPQSAAATAAAICRLVGFEGS